MTGRGGTYRVVWIPGTDQLLGICHCGADHETDDPIDVWDWLLAHPDGHDERHTHGDVLGRDFTGSPAGV